jgi:hypothetical protein
VPLTTGTHGGDIHIQPIADSVEAMHLVADGGKHYWIERGGDRRIGLPPSHIQTDDAALKLVYDDGNFSIIRDSDIFNAVLISAGRFGIVYSVVMSAVRQYCLHEQRRLTIWQNIKSLVADPQSSLYSSPTHAGSMPDSSRFLQIAISVTPHAESLWHY